MPLILFLRCYENSAEVNFVELQRCSEHNCYLCSNMY